MAKSVFYGASISKYLGFNACITVQGITVNVTLKNEIKKTPNDPYFRNIRTVSLPLIIIEKSNKAYFKLLFDLIN